MDLTWRIASTGAMALAGFAAGKAVEVGWRALTGTPVPEEDETSTLLQVVIFAAASAAVAAVAQHYTSRSMARVFDPTGEKGIRRTPAQIEA